jgi:tetratricopeptide (TPR) repeat protein
MIKQLIFFMLIVLNLPTYGQEAETINRYRQGRLAVDFYEKGLNFFEHDQIPEAIEYLSRSTSLDPNNYLAFYFLGASYEKVPDPEKSLLNYNICLALKPDFTEGLFSRANLLLRSGSYEQAIDDYHRLLNNPSGETQAIFFKGIGYGDKDGDTGFDEVLTMTDREIDVHNSLAQGYMQLNRYDSAVYHFSEAIQLNPKEDLYYVNRGLAFLNWGKTDSAAIDFQKALKINPDNSLAAYNLTLLNPENSSESLEQLNRIISSNPRLPYAFASRAFYYFQQENYHLAIQDYDTAILLDENNASYYLNRGMCYEKIENLAATLRDYLSAVNLDPGDPAGWYNLGNILHKQEKYEDAVEAYSTSIRMDSGRGTAYYNRGLTYFKMGKKKKACEDMQQAASLEVDSALNFIEKHCNNPEKAD